MGKDYNLEILAMNERVKLLILLSKIVFPKYYCWTYPLYMFVQYYKLKQQERIYSVKKIDTAFIRQLASEIEENIIDENYSVLINNRFMKGIDYGVLRVKCGSKITRRYVKLVLTDRVAKDSVELSNSLIFNLVNSLEMKEINSVNHNLNVQIKPIPIAKIKFASEAELVLINSPSDTDNAVIDTVLKNYFNKPKLLHELDVIEIDLKNYSQDLPCNLAKIMNFSKSIFFKCTKTFPKVVDGIPGYFIITGETAVKQAANIQSYVPSCSEIQPKLNNELYLKKREGIPVCPYGLEDYAAQIEKAVKPFLVKDYNMHPAFLLTGKKGCGKEILVSSLASKFGMHLYKVTNFDVSALVYAQNETKLKNIFFNSKLCAPCIVYMKNFEHFEKNNEGQTDERIITHFTSGLKTLFENNKYPVILFCSSNKENISGRLKREFLEIFKINPLTQEERVRNLKWILEINGLSYEGDINEISQKTNSFVFEDLKALVQKARNFYTAQNEDCSSLDYKSFSSALDYMQLHYNESIGAPKVPKVNWEDVGGLTEVKEEIIKTINFPLKHPKLLASSGLRRFGILLFGPPGTGKTLLAKAVATECNLCFLSVKGPELLNMYIGQSEENIREVFQRARAASPCIIFFDELDSLAPNRGVSGDSGGVMDRVVSQLLAEMDGLNERATVFVIGATNRPDLIDPALLRPGRFDKLLYVGPAMDFSSRLSVLKALTRKFHLADDVKLEDVIKMCPENITGADFYGICSNSWTHAVRRNIQEYENGTMDISNMTGKDVVVNLSDFKNALTTVKPSVTASDLNYFEKLRREISSNI